jgi:putative cardiolipin synthase
MLSQEVKRFNVGKSNESGFFLLETGRDAFLARTTFTDYAQHSIDVQYYIWDGDAAGAGLLLRLLEAADRGVKVRILLDDIHMAKADDILNAIEKHPFIEVRVFNQITEHGSKMPALQRLGAMLLHFDQTNRRMHNKVFVVDQQIAIVGGRNIGNRYFDLDESGNFRDLDLLAVGPIAKDVTRAFHDYWNSEWACSYNVALPNSQQSGPPQSKDLSHLRKDMSDMVTQSPDTQTLSFKLNRKANQDDVERFLKGLIWSPAKVLYDSPAKIENSETAIYLSHMLSELPPAKHEVLVESAYFLPSASMLKQIEDSTSKGVEIKILTNSLVSNDVLVMHAGYAKYRKDLLRTNAQLFEWRNDSPEQPSSIIFGIYASRPSLHTKAFVIDRKRAFVGSFNLDPRSIHLNTEIGILIENETLAQRVAQFIERGMTSKNSWRIELQCPKQVPCAPNEQELVWKGGNGETWREEPNSSWWDRLLVRFFGLLPIDSLL